MSDEALRPWMMKPLDEWSIVGMNHYSVDGERRLFVAMSKDGRCIKAEGQDDRFLWNRLWHQAMDEGRRKPRVIEPATTTTRPPGSQDRSLGSQE